MFSCHFPRLAPFALAMLSGLIVLPAQSQTASTEPPPALISPILQDLNNFRETGRVLYVAAHPDDENTALITYLARGRGYRTAYLSVTRGDGGQNLLGPEFGPALGLARTEELLAARRLDGGVQFFTRALDFGFSKDVGETLINWDRQQVVADIVRVIRSFHPDVVITRFSPVPGPVATHGHHTASAVLALEAFKLAGDPKAFPEQLNQLSPWQPKRILQNGGGGGRGAAAPLAAGAIQIDAGGNDPVIGESFGDIAARSRAMHKTQGFGNFAGGGAGGGARGPSVPRPESFTLLAGDPATKDLMDGIDLSWSRFPGGAAIGTLATEAIAQFSSLNPAASVPALLKMRSLLAKLPTGPELDDKRQQLDHLLQECLGLSVETTVPQAEVVPGETLTLVHSVTLRSTVPVKWTGVHYPKGSSDSNEVRPLKVDVTTTRSVKQMLPATTLISQPYWLREEGRAGMFRVDDPTLIGRPENPPAFPVEFVFEVGDQKFAVTDEPVQILNSGTAVTSRRRLDVIPPVSISFASKVSIFAPNSSHPVEVDVTSARPDTSGKVQLDVPSNWKITPASLPFNFATAGEHARFSFTLTAPPQPITSRFLAHAQIGKVTYSTDRLEMNYSHLPRLLLQPKAQLKAVSMNLEIRGKNVGYLPGAGDSVAASIEQMGYKVTELTGADLTADHLKQFDAVVIGVRAYNTRNDLAAALPGLFAYVEAGGTVVAQYNRPGRDLKTEQIAPFSLRLSEERVTDEHAPATFLAPDHPALNTPNKITPADFEDWTQERGSYFPNQWDTHFTSVLAFNDAGEAPLKGGLLIAQSGKGYFVYTGLSFFRQLPDGVPGAYRLFANLLSLGK